LFSFLFVVWIFFQALGTPNFGTKVLHRHPNAFSRHKLATKLLAIESFLLSTFQSLVVSYGQSRAKCFWRSKLQWECFFFQPSLAHNQTLDHPKKKALSAPNFSVEVSNTERISFIGIP
jgi:hypothetical protein